MIDDIEDRSENRRGQPCTHKIYGLDYAINAGNTMYFLPFITLSKNREKFGDTMIADIYETTTSELTRLHYGQAMDIHWHNGKDRNVTEKQYLQMCAYKTGTLARLSAKLAAIVSGATEEQIEKLGAFAESIGVAFQIQDDLLNVSGDPEKFVGKDIGDDITEGKRSLMVIHTLQKAGKEDANRLNEILEMHTTDKKLIKEAIEILKKYNSFESSKKVAKEIVQNSWEEVNDFLPESKAKEKIKAFANFLIEREV